MTGPGTVPYATVIVPTHDRASTLDLAVDAIQRQTIPNIEIVISGDGATEEVRAVARGLAAADPRIVFHDFPKAPKRGGANRDRAVRGARSPRIFYCDDDDLLLPRHVETLGPLLDDFDAADSAPAFVSCSGRVQVGLVNHSRGAMRDALATGTAKATYDTHFAHRSTAYARVENPWAADGDRVARESRQPFAAEPSVTWNFFHRFAAEPSITWKSVPDVTALSFNGRVRRHVSPADRRAELKRWRRRAPDDAYYEWHAFAFVRSMGEAAPKTLEDYLAASFISVNGSIPESRLADLRDLFALLRGEPLERGDLCVRLADPLFGWARPNVHGGASALLWRALGMPRTLAALRRVGGAGPLLRSALGSTCSLTALRGVCRANAYDREMRAFMECWLFMVDGRPRDALRRMEELIEAGPFYRAEAHIQAAIAWRQMKETEKALDWARAAIRQDPTLKTGHQLAVDLCLERGMIDAAREISNDARAFLPDHIATALARRVEALP